MKLAKVLAKAKRGIAYLTESAVLDFTIDLERTLRQKRISQAELARRIGTSPAYVSKVLSGQGNLTVKSMVVLGHALNCRVRVQLEPLAAENGQLRWENVGTAYSNRIHVSASPITEVEAANQEWLTLKAA